MVAFRYKQELNTRLNFIKSQISDLFRNKRTAEVVLLNVLLKKFKLKPEVIPREIYILP